MSKHNGLGLAKKREKIGKKVNIHGDTYEIEQEYIGNIHLVQKDQNGVEKEDWRTKDKKGGS